MQLPKEITKILNQFKDAGFDAFAVGGCVRDILLGEKPKDWDITTNARPDKIQEIFPDSFYENQFGTVGIKVETEEETLKVVEATTYRIESEYSDKRHPDELQFAELLDDDLKRRDFTVNALAMDGDGNVVDLFSGKEDLENKILKAVGDPNERFNEDALRMMRAVRFAVALNFEIEPKTLDAIKKHHELLKLISAERIRDEFIKIVDSNGASRGMELLKDTGLMKYILPELLEGVDVGQNKHHIYTVWEHNVRALQYAMDKKYSTTVRLASLLHDVGKPRTKRGDGPDSTFYNHEVVGAKMTAKIMERLKLPKKQAEDATRLVRYHLFYYNVGEVTESSVRRLVANIGRENTEDLIKVREADRIGSGVPKAKPYKLRHLMFMIDKVSRDPISPKMLKLKGDELMKLLGIEPSPRVGFLISALMGEVLDDPAKNDKDYLTKRVKELHELSDNELAELAKAGKTKTLEEEEKEVGQIKTKHHVK
ncbi:MAG: HD domain-containing protein [bacterium]|nr:HD domain-containing protein [bacterium]